MSDSCVEAKGLPLDKDGYPRIKNQGKTTLAKAIKYLEYANER